MLFPGPSEDPGPEKPLNSFHQIPILESGGARRAAGRRWKVGKKSGRLAREGESGTAWSGNIGTECLLASMLATKEGPL